MRVTFTSVLDAQSMKRSFREIRAARDLLLSAAEFDFEHAARLVGPEIASSWQRSHLYGLDPGACPVLPRTRTHKASHRLLAAATPVLQELRSQLDETVISLADRSSRIVWRDSSDHSLIDRLSEITPWEEGRSLSEEFLGTNGVGTEAEVRGPLLVAGPAHYMDVCQDVTAASMYVTDPITGRLEAIVCLTRPQGQSCDALLPLAVVTARRIEARLLEESSTQERALLEAFVRASATRAEMVVSLNDSILIINPAATELLDPTDHATLWQWARRCIATRRPITGTVALAGERLVAACCSPVSDGSEVVGVVVTMSGGNGGSHVKRGASTRRSYHTGSVWAELREKTHGAALENGRVLLNGERGVGKTAMAEQVCACLPDAFPVRTVDCELGRAGARRQFVAELGAALDGGAGCVVLRHIDALTTQSALVVASKLRNSDRRVLLTCSPRKSTYAGLDPILNLVDVEIDIPPLRERADEVPTLASTLLQRLSTDPVAPRCSDEVLAALTSLDWPGNVAELKRVLKSALVNSQGEDIQLANLPRQYRSSGRLLRNLAGMERAQRDAILEALERSCWNHEDAAEDLGISRATIYRKVKQLGIISPRAPVRIGDK